MFFKKKAPTLSNDDIMGMFMDSLITLASSVVQDQANDRMEATLVLDDQMRVKAIENFTLNGQPQAPDTDVIEAINKDLAPLSQLPDSSKPVALSLVFADGGGGAEPQYAD